MFGTGNMDLVIRGSDGLRVFYRTGPRRAWQQAATLADLSDANGFGLLSSYSTIRTVRLKDAGTGAMRTFLMGRGPNGISVYRTAAPSQNASALLSQATPFPPFTSGQMPQAYQILSNLVGGGDNVRQTYGYQSNDYAVWHANETAMREQAGKPASGIDPDDWEAVRSQLQTEFGYVAAVKAWFANNQALSEYVYSASADQLIAVENGVTLSSAPGGTSASVILNWLQLVLDFISRIAGALGQPEISIVTGIFKTVFNTAIAALPSGGNPVGAQVFQIATQLSDLRDSTNLANACGAIAVTSDWGLLQSLGKGSVDGTYSWGQNTTPPELAQAEDLASSGQELWMYKTLSAPTWKVWWCDPTQWPFGGCEANSSYNAKYIFNLSVDNDVVFTAYVVLTHGFAYPYFPAFDRISGPLGANWKEMLVNQNGWNLTTPITADRACEPFPWCVTGEDQVGGSTDRVTVRDQRQLITQLRAFRDSIQVERQKAGGGTGTPDTLTPIVDTVLNLAAQEIEDARNPLPGRPIKRVKNGKGTQAIAGPTDTISQLLQHFILVTRSLRCSDLSCDGADRLADGAYSLISERLKEGASASRLGRLQ